ncbi:MAG TPA: thioesterase domain-containing protein [Gemmataceae bacterium]|nr:thioesterase domain-containing protein [Gemmataceae bacterium]
MAAPPFDPWFPFVRPKPAARLRLFCLPFAGGGASAYRGWAEQLPLDVDAWPVQLPGRESRFGEPAYTRMDRLIPHLTAAVRPHLDRPYALFGHSMGSSVALELARRLARDGRRPAALIVSGNAAPHLPPRQPPIHNLPDAELRGELRKMNGTPAEVLDNDELMRAVLPTIRADCALCETYTPRDAQPLDCPILALGGSDDPRVTVDDVKAWQTYTRGPFESRILHGDHFFVHSQRSAVIAAVARFLSSTRTSGPPAPDQTAWESASAAPPLAENAVHLWQVRLDGGEERERRFASTLAPEELARAERFHFRIDRQRWVIGRGAVRQVLAGYVGVRPADVRLCYGSQGKPALAGESDRGRVNFNVSHSGELLFLAIAKEREIGVDVERIRPRSDWRELAGRYFAPAEVAALDRVPDAARDRAFFQCWTRKEAYIKAHGLGMSLPLDRFAVSLGPGEPARLVNADHDPTQLGRWTLRDVSPGNDYAAALAVEGSGWDLWCGICPDS